MNTAFDKHRIEMHVIGGGVRRPTRLSWTTKWAKAKLHHLASWKFDVCVCTRIYQQFCIFQGARAQIDYV
jgi:hypothetical protein